MTRPAVAAMVILMACLPALQARGDESRMPVSIHQVKQKHAAELMSVPGVVSVGIGRDERGQPVLIVGLDRDRPEARARLPKRLEGYDVRTQVVGPIKAQ